MATPPQLTPEALYQRCDPAQFQFATTTELNNFDEIIGQERAVEAIRFGIGIHKEGFNLYALGPNGTGKHTAVRQFLGQKAATEPTPDDWCYVHNFDQPHHPHAIRLPAGQVAIFSADMKRLVEDLFTVLPAAFASEEYGKKKKALSDALKERESQALETLKQEAQEHNLALIRTPQGVGFAPLNQEGDVLKPEAFIHLSADEQNRIEKQISTLQETLQQLMQQVPQWHREIQKRIKELNTETGVFATAPLFTELQNKYQALPDVLAYLDAVHKDIIENVDDFLDSDESALAAMVGMASSELSKKAQLTRYEVNVLVDNSDLQGAPVIYEDQPTYNTLIGRAEHVSEMGNLLTNFTLIKPGVLHRANGGYLILDARKLLLQPYAWEGIKRALRASEIRIESLGQIYSLVSTVSLQPEPIPLHIKVVLLGERMLYYLLCQYDPDFGELFKVAADFEDDMARNEENNMAYARLIGALARKEQLRHFDREAVARMIEQSARVAEDANKLSTHMQTITDVLREADFWAGEAGRDVVTHADVQRALEAQKYRVGRIRERMQELIMAETILIDTAGSAVGQINGLSVYMLGGYAFGKPSRITARARLGKGEVIDIERQVEMGGPIHSKGVMILSGFLGARYAAERPFSLSATLVFEQSYSGVEGDSASSAELYALLSALAELPLKQSLAVTGSVNQYGQVQAIGGVNEKIEGFFDLCQARGLTGEHGVLIPAANRRNLMLRQDVVAAVADELFHIYPIETIDQGIEILTGIPAGEMDEDDNFPPDSVNGRVMARLHQMAEKQRAFSTPPSEG